MALSEVQRGNIGETEAAKCFMLSSDGDVECDKPASDDEHRDAEVHRRHHFMAVALQIKTTWRLWTHRQSQVIQVPFTVHVRRLVSDERFYYLFAYFDKKTMTFRDPLFLVPSTVVHKHAMPRIIGQRWHFTFQASLKPGARDFFSQYRTSRAKVGKALLEIIGRLEHREARGASRTKLKSIAGVVWVRSGGTPHARRKAA